MACGRIGNGDGRQVISKGFGNVIINSLIGARQEGPLSSFFMRTYFSGPRSRDVSDAAFLSGARVLCAYDRVGLVLPAERHIFLPCVVA